MDIRDGFIDSIGRTPLMHLGRLSKATGCEILAKAEFLNPGGSVKDRAALYIVRDAEARGTLRPGGTIVEGTAGNTGIGLALVGNALGYRSIIVIPDTQSQEKIDMLRLCGADVRAVPAVPGVVYSATATPNVDGPLTTSGHPLEYRVDIEVAWKASGVERTRKYTTLLLRQVTFGERMRRRFVDEDEE